jgi:hypothetical protein
LLPKGEPTDVRRALASKRPGEDAIIPASEI